MAVSIFAVVSVMAYGGLHSVLSGREAVAAQADRLGALQRAFTVIQSDLEQAAPRGIRNRHGDPEPPMLTDMDALRFTRTGRPNPLGLVRSNLQRVGYRLGAEGDLVRSSWKALDQPIQETEADEQRLLGGVDAISFRFLGTDGTWQADWPPPTAGDTPPSLPRAVSVQLDLEDYGQVERIFRMPR